ncbi:alpha/beta hydrolase [Wenxinia marina]|uniref:Esterase/lipase n=1 Tax=Wenxinia marina DSM 24838 TaxID=1123501 RepID=A0A0D0QFP5_9RHOB|nr:alpha/beta hydrolase [Wenxinia marina]KIQ69843.1 Esterase/lipase [Wenxinia marina DSM 24838]GGL61660.1 esterase [Wenxinia marina]
MIDWTDAFENGAYIAGAADIVVRWADAASDFRDAHPPEVLAWGDHPRQAVDLWRPEGEARGLAVFLHGGYWKAFDRTDWSHLAAGALARGWAVALPGYRLAPEVRVSEIVHDAAAGVQAAAEAVGGPIRLAGHSAGGHLVLRLAGADAPLASAVRERIGRVVSISGVHDLRPLRLAAMNEVLRLDEAEAEAESAVLRPPPPGPATLWVGAAERPEFLRQTRALGEAWGRAGGDVREVYDPGRNHFTVVDALADPGSPLTEAWLA